MKFIAGTVLATSIFTSLAHDQLIVQTQQGSVIGTVVVQGVRQFLGIPYAVANRWEPPRLPPTRSVTFNATSFGVSCVQEPSISNLEFLKLAGLGDQHVQESEECLSINIWAPSSTRKQGTAVMIWLYGGGFEFGTSNTTFYNGSTLVENNDDVLLVTLNYRLNIFGFPNAPQLSGDSQSQNFGALDIDAAIQWVHDNIAAFGGDPNRIILFGQSAGAAIASAYTFSHPSDDTIVKGIIQESGSLAGLSPAIPAFGGPINPTAWNQVANAVGCGNTSTPDQLTCMKDVPFRTLEDAVVSTNNDFQAVQDGITFFADTEARSAAGNFLHVPLLVGNTAQEGDIFIVSLEQQSLGFNIPGTINFASDIFTEVIFNCPASTTAGNYVKAGVPVWRYRYEAIFPDISTPSLRAFHSSEIPLIFGTFNFSPLNIPPTPVEISLSKYLQSAWVAFARDPQNGLLNFGWPPYNPSTASLAQLGNSANATGVVFTKGNSFDGSCQLTGTLVAILLKLLSLLRNLS